MIKHIKFAELPVDDQGRAVKFYTEKVGFILAQDSPYQDDWRWVELEIPGAQTRLLSGGFNSEVQLIRKRAGKLR